MILILNGNLLYIRDLTQIVRRGDGHTQFCLFGQMKKISFFLNFN